MRAAVKKDVTVRTINLEVAGAPDIDVTQGHHRKPRIFRPDSVTIRLVDGNVGHVDVRGGLVLKSGAASTEVREHQEWTEMGWSGNKLADAPKWLALLINEAPNGVTTWRGKVQTL